jgi:hypothetical protein
MAKPGEEYVRFRVILEFLRFLQELQDLNSNLGESARKRAG